MAMADKTMLGIVELENITRKHNLFPSLLLRAGTHKSRILNDNQDDPSSTGIANLGRPFMEAILRAAPAADSYSYGGAIALGMLAALRYSVEADLMSEMNFLRIETMIRSYRIPTLLQVPVDPKALTVAFLDIVHGKKKKPRPLVLLHDINKASPFNHKDDAILDKVWQALTPEYQDTGGF
jgi:3-dehydroquinate synthetase